MDLRIQLECLMKAKSEAVARYEKLLSSLNNSSVPKGDINGEKLNGISTPPPHTGISSFVMLPDVNGGAEVGTSSVKKPTSSHANPGSGSSPDMGDTHGPDLFSCLQGCAKAVLGLSSSIGTAALQLQTQLTCRREAIWTDYAQTEGAMRELLTAEGHERKEEERKRLAPLGYTRTTIDIILDDEKPKKYREEPSRSSGRSTVGASDEWKPSRAPVYAKVHREYLAIDPLIRYNIPYEYDKTDPDYIIILRDMDEYEIEMLFEYTKRLQTGRIQTRLRVPSESSKYEWSRSRDLDPNRVPEVRKAGILDYKTTLDGVSQTTSASRQESYPAVQQQYRQITGFRRQFGRRPVPPPRSSVAAPSNLGTPAFPRPSPDSAGHPNMNVDFDETTSAAPTPTENTSFATTHSGLQLDASSFISPQELNLDSFDFDNFNRQQQQPAPTAIGPSTAIRPSSPSIDSSQERIQGALCGGAENVPAAVKQDSFAVTSPTPPAPELEAPSSKAAESTLGLAFPTTAPNTYVIRGPRRLYRHDDARNSARRPPILSSARTASSPRDYTSRMAKPVRLDQAGKEGEEEGAVFPELVGRELNEEASMMEDHTESSESVDAGQEEDVPDEDESREQETESENAGRGRRGTRQEDRWPEVQRRGEGMCFAHPPLHSHPVPLSYYVPPFLPREEREGQSAVSDSMEISDEDKTKTDDDGDVYFDQGDASREEHRTRSAMETTDVLDDATVETPTEAVESSEAMEEWPKEAPQETIQGTLCEDEEAEAGTREVEQHVLEHEISNIWEQLPGEPARCKAYRIQIQDPGPAEIPVLLLFHNVLIFVTKGPEPAVEWEIQTTWR